MSRQFEKMNHAALYATYRPHYPKEIYNAILDFMDNKEGTTKKSLAVDVACGSGQSTVPLAKYFDRVVGTDISEAQIQQAKQRTTPANVEYLVSAAEDLSIFEDGSVDLVTCAMAAHWLDRPKFYDEVRRVLRPGGVVVVYSYGIQFLNNKEATELLLEFVDDTLGPYFTDGSRQVRQGYKNIHLPFPGIRNDFKIPKTMTVQEHRGFLESTAAYQAFLKCNPNSSALENLSEKLADIYANDYNSARDKESEIKLQVTFPIYLILGKQPDISS